MKVLIVGTMLYSKYLEVNHLYNSFSKEKDSTLGLG